MKQTIYLTGFMGSGKTTIGQALGKALGYSVIDTDEWIEESRQKKVRDIFQDEGEDFFRELETEALLTLNQKPLVVTTGGGIIIKEHNRKLMNDCGIVVFLDCDLEEIIRRTEGDDTRPLLQNKDKQAVIDLYQKRMPLYQEAAVRIDTTGKTVLQIVQELKGLLLKV
ncbi:shikimate kinase [Bacillus solitudinis]|uniref:shikimate kinase n=1 Tax=Bacillus solitudinis TaxID=2014074 RepID=UPI000C240E4B